jgi:hypothetical protein
VEIFASQGAPPVSIRQIATGINNTSVNIFHQFASVVDTGGKLPPVITTPAANLPLVKRNRWQTMATIIKLLTT